MCDHTILHWLKIQNGHMLFEEKWSTKTTHSARNPFECVQMYIKVHNFHLLNKKKQPVLPKLAVMGQK